MLQQDCLWITFFCSLHAASWRCRLHVKVGVCVVAGNVRRTAEIALGDPGSAEYIDLKNYDKNPDRADFGWASNNSVLAKLGMDYSKVL